jgi:hypothetical protein
VKTFDIKDAGTRGSSAAFGADSAAARATRDTERAVVFDPLGLSLAAAAQGLAPVHDGAEPVLRLVRSRIMDPNRLRPGDAEDREAALTAIVIDSQSVKTSPAGRDSTPPKKSTVANNSRVASGTSPSTPWVCRSNARLRAPTSSGENQTEESAGLPANSKARAEKRGF